MMVMIFCGLVFTQSAIAEVYKWVDENGETHISDAPVMQGNTKYKYEKQPGRGAASQSNSGKDIYAWYRCDAVRGKETVIALLKEQEGWDVRYNELLFVTTYRQGDVIGETYGLGSYRVEVKYKMRPEDTNLCRVLGLEKR